jgi:hypothetical protein
MSDNWWSGCPAQIIDSLLEEPGEGLPKKNASITKADKADTIEIHRKSDH